MKELSIQEKAKRYDEAIEIAKDINNEQRAQPFNVMTRVFPELAESEDEKIRKEILSFLKEGKPYHCPNSAKRQEWATWLEKQGEQKPAWLSKEDEDYYDAIIVKLEITKDDAMLTDNQMDFLKSLKDRVQPQPRQEWSEEDEEILKELTKFIPYHLTAHSYNQYYNWAISHRPQPHWKPSDEHYELEEFAKIVRGNLTGISEDVQEQFEAKYLQLTGNKMYGGFID